MAIKKFNTVAGLSVGEDASIDVIDSRGNVSTGNLTVTGVTDLGDVANIVVNGGAAGYVLSTDGTGNLAWESISAGIAGLDTEVQFNVSGNFGASSAFTFNYIDSILNVPTLDSNTVLANYFAGDGTAISNITGANVTGFVPNATLASSATFATSAGTSTTANYVIEANQPNITSLGELTNLVVTQNSNLANVTANTITASFFVGDGYGIANINGANVSEVPNANYSTYSLYTLDANLANLANNAVTVVGNDQPNITGLGNLGQLVVLGNADLTDVTANILSANGIVSNSTLYVAGDTTIAGNLIVYGAAIYADVTSLIVQDPIIEQGGMANGAPLPDNDGFDRGQVLHYYNDEITAPVDAFMGWKNDAKEFAFVSNGSLVNNIVTIHQYGNVHANMFIGNGALLTDINGANITEVANANYATYAGTAFSVDGSNVTGVVATANLATFASTAYSIDGSNIVGEVANANFATLAGTVNSISGSNVIGDVANATYANVAAAAYSVDGANVFGEVANANYASYAGNIVTSAQPNITSVGTLTSLSVSGNIVANNVTANTLIQGTNATITNTLVTSNANITTAIISGNITANNANIVANLSLGNLLFSSAAGGIFIDGSGGNIGQIPTATGLDSVEWRDKFYVGPLPPQANGIFPNYGDIWFYVEDGETRMYMWVTDGESDFFYDFLPPTF
jgi:hypothetical protein